MQKNPILTTAIKTFNEEIIGLQKVRDTLNQSFVNAVNLILNTHGKVIVSGMGKSGHVATKIAATLASTGTPAFFVHPAEALHGDLGMVEKSDLFLGISYSGESDELLQIIPLLKEKSIKIITLSGRESSSLAKVADCHLLVEIDKEACPLNLAPTTSTTATMVLGDALAVCLLSLRQFKPEDFALSHPGGSLGRKLLTKVADIMHTGNEIPSLSINANLKEIVVEISAKRLGLVIITNQSDLLGVITDGDLRRALEKSEDIRQLTAKEIMTKSPRTIKATDLAVNALDLMESNHKVTNLIVLNDTNQVCGILHMHDLIKAKIVK